MTASYLFRTPENSKFFSISIEGWSYRESTASTFSYWTRTCHVSQNLKNTFTMLSSEVDGICSFSVWEDTSFCLNKKTVNEMIIILLNTSTISYWRRTCTCHRAKKNTLTMLSVEAERISSSSVWEETSFCWNKKTVNEMIVILLNTSTFFLLFENMSRVTELKKYLNDVFVRVRQNFFLFRLGRNFFLLEEKDSK